MNPEPSKQGEDPHSLLQWANLFRSVAAICVLRALWIASDPGTGVAVTALIALAVICMVLPQLERFELIQGAGVTLKMRQIRQMGDEYVAKLEALNRQAVESERRIRAFIEAYAKSLLVNECPPEAARDAIALMENAGLSADECKRLTQPWIDARSRVVLDEIRGSYVCMIVHDLEIICRSLQAEHENRVSEYLKLQPGSSIPPGHELNDQHSKSLEGRIRVMKELEAAISKIPLERADDVIGWLEAHWSELVVQSAFANRPDLSTMGQRITPELGDRIGKLKRFRASHDPDDYV